MGIIQRQSIKHSIISYIGVAIGLLSVVFIYPKEEEIYGLFQLFFSSALICSSIFMLGFNVHAIRFFPVFQNKENGNNGFLNFLLTGSFVGFVLFLLLLPFIKYLFLNVLFDDKKGQEIFTEYFFYIIPLVFLFIFNQVFLKYISNFHRIVIPNILNDLLIKIVLPALIVLYILGLLSVEMFIQGVVLNYVLVLIGFVFYTKSLGQLHLKSDFKFIKKPLAKEIREYSLFGLLNALGSRLSFTIDQIMVSAMIGIASGGAYSIIRVISDVINKPNQAIQAIASPIISESWNTNNLPEIKKIYQKSSLTLLIFGSYIFLGVWVSIDDLFSIMPNSKATQTGKYVFLFLGLSRVIDLATSVNTIIIGYSKRFRFNFYALLVLAVFSIIFNIIFIRQYQIVGAAIATFCTQTLFNIVNVLYVNYHFRMQPFTAGTFKLLTIAVLIGGFVYWLPVDFYPIINILIRSILLTILYGGITYYWKISPDANQLVDSFLEKIKSKFYQK